MVEVALVFQTLEPIDYAIGILPLVYLGFLFCGCIYYFQYLFAHASNDTFCWIYQPAFRCLSKVFLMIFHGDKGLFLGEDSIVLSWIPRLVAICFTFLIISL